MSVVKGMCTDEGGRDGGDVGVMKSGVTVWWLA